MIGNVPELVIRTSPFLEMDRETFDIMWKMSAPGHPAEECFLRARQEELYCEKDIALSGPFDEMPEACHFILTSSPRFVEEVDIV